MLASWRPFVQIVWIIIGFGLIVCTDADGHQAMGDLVLCYEQAMGLKGGVDEDCFELGDVSPWSR